ncbi:glycosyltransferase family 4 protein [Alphaproteobacteria bacterium]|nr:glycosyltransferase family 4 protein [Alphaproteobacteria bacterium]
MRILFTTPILEHPPAGGPQLRIANSIKALSQICELDIIHRSIRPKKDVEATAAFYRQYTKEYVTIFKRSPKFSSSWFNRQYLRVIKRLFDHEVENYVAQILEHVERRKINVVWFGYGNISYPLIKKVKAAKPELKVVCDTDSVWSRFVMRELPYARGLRKLRILYSGLMKKVEERAWVDLCEVTTAVSEVDAEYYQSLTKNAAKVRVFSNVVDVSSYDITVPAPGGFKSPSIYLAGTFGHYYSAMDTAARWVLEEILPKILPTYPNLHFYVVGRGSNVSFGHVNSPNVTVTGELESVLPYLKYSDIALVPLKFESGTRFKILEAGSCSIPLVSTALGAEGIPVKHGEHILIADTAEEFAESIIHLLNDKKLGGRLATNCHDLVSQMYSVEALVEEAKDILEYLNHG